MRRARTRSNQAPEGKLFETPHVGIFILHNSKYVVHSCRH